MTGRGKGKGKGKGRRPPPRNRRANGVSTDTSWHSSSVRVRWKIAKIAVKITQLVHNRHASLRSASSRKVQYTEQLKVKELALDESSYLNLSDHVNNDLDLNGSPNAQLAVISHPLRSANRSREMQYTSSPLSSSSEDPSDESTSSFDHLVDYDSLLQSVRVPAAASSPPVSFTSTSRAAKDTDKVEALTRYVLGEIVVDKAPPTEVASNTRKCTFEESSNEHLFRENHSAPLSSAPNPNGYITVASEQVTEGDVIETSNIGGGKHEGSQTKPYVSHIRDRSLSLNLTEMVNMLHDDASCDSEIESVSPSLVEVSGYKVKEASADIIRRIIEKYGDIGLSCTLATVKHRSWLLERVCDIIETFQNRSLKDMAPGDVESHLKEVSDLRGVKMRVDWLLSKLEKIYEAKKLVKDCYAFKERRSILIHERDEAKKELKGCRTEKLELEQRGCYNYLGFWSPQLLYQRFE